MTPSSHRKACVAEVASVTLEPTTWPRLLIAAAWLHGPPSVPRSMGAGCAPAEVAAPMMRSARPGATAMRTRGNGMATSCVTGGRASWHE